MKRFNPLVLLIALLVLFSMTGIASAITLAERDELNNATPGTQKVGLGTILRAQTAVGVKVLMTADTATGADQVLPCSVEPSGDTGYVRKFTGAVKGDSVSLGDCNPGQTMTIALVSDGGQNFVITPDTASGFRAITFADAGDNATLRFVDTTVGWVVVGTADVSSGPLLTTPSAASTPGFK